MMEGIALRTNNASDRIALRGVRIHARLAGMSQGTTVEQTFVNLEPHAIEAVYTFPLPEGAAVCAFEVITGDRVLTGVIEESDRAIEQYDNAIADGDAAFLMEQERPDVFTVRVGNLKPRQAATIRLTYVCPLDRVDKQIRIAFPTTIAPRYVTATATDPLEAMVDGDVLNPPHALYVPYGLSMTVEIDLGRTLTGVFSPSHSIDVERASEAQVVVKLAASVTEMNRDVVLNLELTREHEPSVQIEREAGGESYLAVTFVPEFDESELVEAGPMETVFLLDCSGSMQGDSIQQAIVALELCLRSLSPGDTFNVCRFGSTYELMASEPYAYSQPSLERALKYVRASGDLGGTELYAPLEAILKTPPGAGHVRQVILLTDGQVSNEPAIIELARKHRRHNRIFTFGIGPACSAYLVKGLARATGGAAEFITTGERIDEKVLRTFSRLASPMVSEVTIDWDNCDVHTLAELPPVFDGDVMTVFGRTAGRVPNTVTLSCKTPAGPRSWKVPVGQSRDHGGVVGTMWARRMIQSLEEVNAVPRVPRRAKSREQEMLINLSKQFGLLCSLTTFIAIEHRSLAERNEGRPGLRRVPVQLAQGWGGVVLGSLASPMNTIDKTMDATIDRLRCSISGPVKPSRRATLRRYTERSMDAAALGDMVDEADFAQPIQGPALPQQEFSSRGSLQSVLRLQTADGWFEWDDALVGKGDRRQHLETAISGWLGGLPDLKVIATVAALVRLRTAHRDEHSLWRRAERKALRWLADAARRGSVELEQWLNHLSVDPQLAPGAVS